MSLSRCLILCGVGPPSVERLALARAIATGVAHVEHSPRLLVKNPEPFVLTIPDAKLVCADEIFFESPPKEPWRRGRPARR